MAPRVRALKIGSSTDNASEMGPLVTRQHLDKVRGYVDIGVAEGAELVVDGRDIKMQGYENGFFIGPSLFDKVTPRMTIWREEIFGPVATLIRFTDEADAIRDRLTSLRVVIKDTSDGSTWEIASD